MRRALSLRIRMVMVMAKVVAHTYSPKTRIPKMIETRMNYGKIIV
jgi:hypothetical protein